MSKLVLVVPRSRGYCGRGVLLGADGKTRLGPFRVLATASRRVAARHGNPDCDPLRPFGHPPAGTYVVASSMPPGVRHHKRPRRFGAAGSLLLAPQSGAALASLARGRLVFALHGEPLDPGNRLRPTRGGLRLADGDMSALLRAINAAQASDDPLESVELLEVSDADVRSVPALDLRGTRRVQGLARQPRSRRRGEVSKGAWLLLAGVGAAQALRGRSLDRREVLQAALLLVGGLVSSACSQPSPCTPLACDPGEPVSANPSISGDGGAADAPGAADGTDGGSAEGGPPDASDASADGGAPDASDGGGAPDASGGDGRPPGAKAPPCPPSGYICEEDDPGYVATGGVG